MSIGTRRPRGVFGAILQLAQNYPVFTADYYAVDGITGKVASFIDWNDPTHTLAQAVSAQQVAIPATHADYGGKLCASFAGSQWYDSTRVPSRWAFLYDGSGGGLFTALTNTGTGVSRTMGTAPSTSAYGILLGYLSSTSSLYLVGNSTAQQIANANRTVAASTPLQISGQYKQDGSVNAKSTGSAEFNSVGAFAPSSASAQTFRLGAATDNVNPLTGRFRSVVATPFVGEVERSAVRAWIQQDTGITP